MARVANSVAELVGQTPIVKLNRIVDENSADVYLKLEYFNPGSSVKDRIALAMIEAAEKEGLLKEGSTIIEPTSGELRASAWRGAAAKGIRGSCYARHNELGAPQPAARIRRGTRFDTRLQRDERGH